MLGNLPFCASTEDDGAEFGGSHRRPSSGKGPAVFRVTLSRDSVDGLSLDDLILESGSSVNSARSSRYVSR